MKCDELEFFFGGAASWAEVYKKSDVDAAIAELKAENRKLKRALYKACTNWARSERYTEATWHGDEHREELWAKVEVKCLKKAEECKLSERKYFVLSLKHLFPWKFGQPLCLWGYKRTADNEPRCFCGYNTKPSTSELYTIEDFLEKYGKYNAVKKEPINNFFVCTFKGLKKHYDDVIIEKESVENYYKMCELEL